MATTLHIGNASTEGGALKERLVMALLWCIAWGFVPLKFRGFWRMCRLVLKFGNIKERQWLVLPSSLRFSVDMGDPYWNRLISPKFSYEPELDFLLTALKDQEYGFIDCGANMGFWSCLAASPTYGSKQVIAAEPLQHNFNLLQTHIEANHLNVTAHHNAVTQKSGEKVALYKPGGHASVSLLQTNPETRETEAEYVETITIDDIAAPVMERLPLFFLKLDVEGAEIDALKGATQLLQKETLIFYEDHGNDRTSEATDYIMNSLGYAVYYIAENGQALKIETTEHATRLKADRKKGYNFLAFKDTSQTLHALICEIVKD